MTTTNFNSGWTYCKKGSDYKVPVTLPHDAMILEKRTPNADSGAAGGYFPGGIYEYTKTFIAPAEWADKHVFLEFEGVYQNAAVYLNGVKIGGCAYGYSPFTAILDKEIKIGEENLLTVEADNSHQPSSRWYTGSGIYRPVWLHVANKEHILHQGVKISTLSYSPARILIKTTYNAKDNAEVKVEIFYKGKLVSQGTGASLELDIPDASLWSEDSPALYECKVSLLRGDTNLDESTECFGIRKIEWSSKGLFINGKNTLLRGACVHHDNGILGARSYAEAEKRRVRILKEAGYNAIRSSHNPASKAMLDACDERGVYVIDETWDMWYSKKSKHDYSLRFLDNYKYDITAMVQRNFNNPSVIMYSICNEVSEPKDEKGVVLAREMVDLFHQLDSTRPVTGGVNLFIIDKAAKNKAIYDESGGLSGEQEKSKKKPMSSLMFNIIAQSVGTSMNKMANSNRADKATTPFLDLLDIAGYNYGSGRYPLEGAKHPGRLIYGSETFPQDIAKNWEMVKKFPYLIGDFMWTGWDYIGEAGMGGWNYSGEGGFEKSYPWLLADGGAIDILGNIGAEAAYASVVWGLRKTPYIGVRPVNHPGVRVTRAVWRGTNAIESWAWQNCEGNKATVEVYADAFALELLINNKKIGKKRIKDYKAMFKTRYSSGTITAVAYDSNGNEISRSDLKSATGKAQIAILPEKSEVAPGEVAYVNLAIAGENGVVESNADTKLAVKVDGGELLAFGSANPKTEESYNTGEFTTYYGRALAVVKAGDDGFTISASGQNFAVSSAKVSKI